MSASGEEKISLGPEKKKHRFFLNPYSDIAFSTCPRCESKTRLRKIPLVIHIEPMQLFVLNKKCKYCTSCDLIIAKKLEINESLGRFFGDSDSGQVGKKYMVCGTIARVDWQETTRGKMTSAQLVDRVRVFKDVWDFEVKRGGWYPIQD